MKQHICSNALETIWLNVRRPDGTLGRRAIGEVVACGFCSKVTGDVKSTGKVKIDGPAWRSMLKYHPTAPWYFNEVDGEMIPEAAPQQRSFVPAKPVAQDLAAKNYDEAEPEYGEDAA